MGTTLEHGVYLPDEGERNCYAGLKVNWETLDQKVADISALQSAIAGALHREIVASLPTTDIDPNTIYMILSGTSATENVYNEFMYVNNAWELIGTSATDLTNYYTKSEVDGKLLLKANASDLNSHTGDTTIHVTASDKAKWNTVALIKQLRLVNTQVGSATTIAFANIDDTNGIKVGDKCMDLDGKMFEITAVDTTNQTVTVGSALIDLALDANVVHTSGNETKNGELTASKFISNYIQSDTGGIQIQSIGTNRSCSMFNGASAGDGGGFWCYGKDSANGSDCRLQIYNTAKSRYERVDLVNSQFLPTPSGELDCGSTSNKWKTFNGLNPGSLSLPDLSNGIDISGYITMPNAVSTYTPSVNGWVSIMLKSTSGAIGLFLYQDDMVNGHYGSTSLPNESEPCVMANLPVKAGTVVNIATKGSNGYVYSAKFYPNLGNV